MRANSEIDHIVSDGYDVAQTAICFLYQFVGRKVSDECQYISRNRNFLFVFVMDFPKREYLLPCLLGFIQLKR